MFQPRALLQTFGPMLLQAPARISEERLVIGKSIAGRRAANPDPGVEAAAAPGPPAGAVYAGVQRDSGGIQNRLGACAFMCLYLGVLGLSSLPIWRAERLLFVRRAPTHPPPSSSPCREGGTTPTRAPQSTRHPVLGSVVAGCHSPHVLHRQNTNHKIQPSQLLHASDCVTPVLLDGQHAS